MTPGDGFSRERKPEGIRIINPDDLEATGNNGDIGFEAQAEMEVNRKSRLAEKFPGLAI